MVTTAGCSFPGCGEDPPVRDLDYGEGEGVEVTSRTYGMFQLLLTQGIPAELGPEVETGFFEKPARQMKVYKSSVFFLEFDDEEEMREVMQTIAADGRSIAGKPIPDEGVTKGTPHFFRRGKVIGFYFGDTKKTLDALNMIFEEQFAGAVSPERPA